MVKDKRGNKNEQGRDYETYKWYLVNRIKEIWEIVNIQILGGIDIGHQEAWGSDYNGKDKQKQNGLVKCKWE
jgi:hypothetical protein